MVTIKTKILILEVIIATVKAMLLFLVYIGMIKPTLVYVIAKLKFDKN